MRENHYIKDRTESITEIKFCPKDCYLAVGGEDCKIIIYTTTNKFRR